MPAYSFEALQADGKTRKGLIEADTAKAARSLLRTQALVPIVVTAVSGSGVVTAPKSLLQTNLFGGRVFNSTGLAIWTRQ